MDASITCMDSAHRRNPPISTEPKLCTLDYFIPSCITPPPSLLGKKGGGTWGVATGAYFV